MCGKKKEESKKSGLLDLGCLVVRYVVIKQLDHSVVSGSNG